MEEMKEFFSAIASGINAVGDLLEAIEKIAEMDESKAAEVEKLLHELESGEDNEQAFALKLFSIFEADIDEYLERYVASAMEGVSGYDMLESLQPRAGVDYNIYQTGRY